MNETSPPGPKSETVTADRDFSGWSKWNDIPFEDKAGPFYHRKTADGAVVAGLRVNHSHTNGIDIVHGGCLVTFADYALFALVAHHRDEREAKQYVTASLNCEFVRPARVGDLVIAYPELVHGGQRLLFVRGVLKIEERLLLSFSGTMIRIPKRN